jgi:hypothetical protein
MSTGRGSADDITHYRGDDCPGGHMEMAEEEAGSRYCECWDCRCRVQLPREGADECTDCIEGRHLDPQTGVRTENLP